MDTPLNSQQSLGVVGHVRVSRSPYKQAIHMPQTINALVLGDSLTLAMFKPL